MLWDMIRFENYDETSPYHREAAGWIKNQEEFRMPLDTRPLRDRLAGYAPRPVASPVFGKPVQARSTESATPYSLQPTASAVRVDRAAPRPAAPTITLATPGDSGVTFIDTPRTSIVAEVVEATVVDDGGIVFIN